MNLGSSPGDVGADGHCLPARLFGIDGGVRPPLRLFVVDDEKLLAWTMSKLLTKFGYEVTTFNDPTLAMEAFRQRPADLVISDVVMPEMSGIELAILIAQHTPGCKVLLLSGQAQTPQLIEKARREVSLLSSRSTIWSRSRIDQPAFFRSGSCPSVSCCSLETLAYPMTMQRGYQKRCIQ